MHAAEPHRGVCRLGPPSPHEGIVPPPARAPNSRPLGTRPQGLQEALSAASRRPCNGHADRHRSVEPSEETTVAPGDPLLSSARVRALPLRQAVSGLGLQVSNDLGRQRRRARGGEAERPRRRVTRDAGPNRRLSRPVGERCFIPRVHLLGPWRLSAVSDRDLTCARRRPCGKSSCERQARRSSSSVSSSESVCASSAPGPDPGDQAEVRPRAVITPR